MERQRVALDRSAYKDLPKAAAEQDKRIGCDKGRGIGIRPSLGNPSALRSPGDCLPLVVDINAAGLRERFDITLTERRAGQIFLKAVPKHKLDNCVFSQIDVILSANTYLASATRMVQPDGRSRVVYVLEEEKINQVPSDRQQLIHPDLSGLRVIE